MRCGAHQRKELERLCRYIARPTIANERLSRNGTGQGGLQLKSSDRDGTTRIVMSALEFMQRLAALVPRPKLHLIRFHGVLAPHAKLRAAVVPDAVQKTSEPAENHAHGKSARMSWARLLKRVYDIDIERPKFSPKTVRLTTRSTGDTVVAGEKGSFRLDGWGERPVHTQGERNGNRDCV